MYAILVQNEKFKELYDMTFFEAHLQKKSINSDSSGRNSDESGGRSPHSWKPTEDWVSKRERRNVICIINNFN